MHWNTPHISKTSCISIKWFFYNHWNRNESQQFKPKLYVPVRRAIDQDQVICSGRWRIGTMPEPQGPPESSSASEGRRQTADFLFSFVYLLIYVWALQKYPGADSLIPSPSSSSPLMKECKRKLSFIIILTDPLGLPELRGQIPQSKSLGARTRPPPQYKY